MKPLQSPALALTWLADSIKPLRLRPVAYTGIVVFSLLISGILSSFPFIGTLLSGIWLSFASVFMGFAARDTLAGRTPSYMTLLAILKDKTSYQPLLFLGLLSSVGMELVVLVFDLLGKESITKWHISSSGIDPSAVIANIPWLAIGVALLLYVPLLCMTLFAPLLIVDKRQTVLKSLFYSFFGILRSFVPALLWLFGLGLLSGLILASFEWLFSTLKAPRFLTFVAPLMVAIVSAACQAGIWAMYRDIFAGNSPDGRVPHDLKDHRHF